MATSSDSFGVVWNPPDPPNGDIVNYTIVYRPVEAVADYDPSTLEGSTTSYTDTDTTVLMAVDLQSAVLYSIQLAATNQIGTSPFSQDLECTILTQDDGEWWLPIQSQFFVSTQLLREDIITLLLLHNSSVTVALSHVCVCSAWCPSGCKCDFP